MLVYLFTMMKFRYCDILITELENYLSIRNSMAKSSPKNYLFQDTVIGRK